MYDLTSYPYNRPPKDQDENRITLVKSVKKPVELKIDSGLKGVFIYLKFAECELRWVTQIVTRIFSYIAIAILEVVTPGLKTLIEDFKDKE